MTYETLLVQKSFDSVVVTFHRPEQRNSFNVLLLKEVHHMLDEAEHDPSCRFIILRGENGFFCTGMDFKEVSSNLSHKAEGNSSEIYMALLKRFITASKIIISLVEGQTLAGGVGIVAASDFVIATPLAQFGLSEALWGLLPACVMPFLIRRIGFQKAYNMTLSTRTILASEAHSLGLIDELAENPEAGLKQLQVRLRRVSEETVGALKAYFKQMWIMTEEMEEVAVSEIGRLLNKPQVQKNIKNFIETGKFPWESGKM